MRADIFYYYPARVDVVYNAYKLAINNVFKKEAAGTMPNPLVFGLNFSFKYNMNGGGCHVHFIPYNNGTAVDVHYTIAQLLGARYKAHAKDLIDGVSKILSMHASEIKFDLDEFQKVEESFIASHNTYFAKSDNEVSAKPFIEPPVNKPIEAPKAKFCSNCGTAFGETALFCSNCGAKRI